MTRFAPVLAALVIAAATAGCPDRVAVVRDAPPGDRPILGPPDGTLAIDPAALAQVIDGFGGANAWQSLPSDPAARARIVTLLFSRSRGAGLSILRNRIPFREQSGDGGAIPDLNDRFMVYTGGQDYEHVVNPDGSKTFALDWTAWDLVNTRNLIAQIRALGDDSGLAAVFSTPWTPPNNATTGWKLGVPDPINYPQIGGSLDPAHYADYADLLLDYAGGFAGHVGMPLAAISIQNEPDYAPDYESCSWTAAQIHDFLGVFAGELAKKGAPAGLRVIAPEGTGFEEALVVPALDDPATAGVVGIVGVHQYDLAEPNFAAKRLPTVKRSGRPLWVTEVSQGTANNRSIADGLYWARLIHTDLTLAEVNAFLYWWLWAASATRSALIGVDGATITDNKRLYTLGQYSRFVRPGWIRIAAATEPVAAVWTSVFRDPGGSQIAVIAINGGTAPRAIDLRLATGAYGTVSAVRTSDTENLAPADSIAVSGDLVRVDLPGQSVTTVYGSITHPR